MGRTYWISALSQEDSQALADLIEKQTGIVLPEEQSNNPFEYKGDIRIKIYAYEAPGLTIRKAKSPFGNEMYYKITFPNRSITFGFFHWLWCPEGSWQAVEPPIDTEELAPLISLVNTCEKNNVWRTEEDN